MVNRGRGNPQEPIQNKRKRVAHEDSDEEVQPKRARSSNQSPDFICRLGGNHPFWRYVQIKGSYPIRRFVTPQVVKNRPLYHLLRDISENLHRNFKNYQKSELREIQKSHPSLDENEVMRLLEKVCKKTMKYESEGLTVVFEVDRLIAATREAFSMDRVQVFFDDLSVFLQQLRLICQVRKVTVSEEELIQMRNKLARFFNYVQTDFIQTILNIDSSGNVRGLRKVSLADPNWYKSRSDVQTLDNYSFLALLQSGIMQRCSETSLWILIPSEDKVNLLDHVLPYALANFLPEDVREFLTDWMVKVQRKMQKQLTNGDLRRVADSLIPEKQRHLDFSSPLIGEFLMKIYDKVLNCQENFKVFNEDWLNELLENLKNTLHWVKYSFTKELLKKSQFQHFESCFPKFDGNLLRHLKANLFHFFIRFCYHTLRFVFRIDLPGRKLINSGDLEYEEMPDFQEIDRVEEQLEISHKSSPVGIPQVQVMKPRRTLLPTPIIVQPTVPQMTFQPPPQNQSSITVPHSMFPVYQPPIQEFKYIPPSTQIPQVPKSVPVNPIRAPKIEPVEPNLSPEVLVIEEKQKSSRALRMPSEVSESNLDQVDEDEGVPKKWKDTYRLLLEWQQDLRDELKNVKERYEKIERL